MKISTRDFMIIEWRFLLFGLLMALFSSLGQTFFISLFSDKIRAALSLSHGDFGTYYAMATTASAITLVWLGKLADVMRVEKLALMVLLSLSAAALFFSQVQSVTMLMIGLFMLRLFGQGMTTHTYATAIARRYISARGRALSIAQLGHTLGESIAPISVATMMLVIDWRTIWMVLPFAGLFLVAPFLRYLTQRTRLQDGGGLGGVNIKKDAGFTNANNENNTLVSNLSGNDTGFDGQYWRRRDVIRDRTFWFGLMWLTAVPSYVLTGVMFHQIYLANLKNVPLSSWTAYYVLYAVFAVIGSLVAGQLVDRFTARRVAPYTMLPTALACICLYFANDVAGISLFFMLFGLAGGTPKAATTAIIAEAYGTRYFGEIKAIFLPIGVFGSALSPMVLGLMIDLGGGLELILGSCAMIAIFAQISSMIVLGHFRKG
ncbi:MFS transporter [Alphaproteobacteria bacterium]|nr:MFS transporter [Alphaproteobacteria bacterium]